jgi:hypothetical protein
MGALLGRLLGRFFRLVDLSKLSVLTKLAYCSWNFNEGLGGPVLTSDVEVSLFVDRWFRYNDKG